MVRHRVRIRFRKDGDLRLISHRDLIRTFERLLRRAGLPLGMSQGFRPKPRMTFASALAVGVIGLDEVMELELAEILEDPETLRRLRDAAPPGLDFLSVETLASGAPKPVVRRLWFEIPVPPDRQATVARAAEEFLARDRHEIRRPDSGRTLDLHALVDPLELADGRLRFGLLMTDAGTARPREVLEALAVGDLESQGHVIVRTQVELDPNPPRRKKKRRGKSRGQQQKETP